MKLFKFAQLFHPVIAITVTGGDFNLKRWIEVDVVLDVLKSLSTNVVDELVADYPQFLSTLNQHVPKNKRFEPSDVKEWWKEYGSSTGVWAATARLFSLLQPSSASAERGFSMMRNAVSDNQTNMLEDMRELRVQKRFRMKKDDA